MNLGRWQRTIVDLAGNVIPGAVITIRRESDQQLVTVYGDKAGEHPYTPTGQATADANGYAYFYVEPGLYRITSSNPAVDWRDVEIGSVEIAQEVDQSWRDFEAQAEYEHDNLRAMLMQSRYGDGPYPTIDWQFAGASRLDPRITFSRASADTVYDASGKLVTLGNDVPAFPYDPATGRALGFRVQAQITNPLLWSDDFSKENWNKIGTVISGQSGHQKLTEDATNARHYMYQSTSWWSADKDYCFSVKVKELPDNANKRYIFVVLPTSIVGVNTGVIFDLATGQWWDRSTNPIKAAGIIQLEDGFLLPYVVARSTASATGWAQILIAQSTSDGFSAAYQGDGESGFEVAYAQAEEGTYPSSKIKTEGSQGTRAADSAIVSGENFSNWFNSSEGTFVLSLTPGGLIDNEWIFDVEAPEYSQILGVYFNTVGRVNARSNDGTEVLIQTAGGVAQTGQELKVAVVYSGSSFALFVNGSKAGTASLNPATLQLAQTLVIGGTGNNSPAFRQCNCPLQAFTYYPRALSDTKAQELTA